MVEKKEYCNLTSSFIVFIMVFSCLIIGINLPEGTVPLKLTENVSASFAGGDGSASDPYQISNVTQLQDISSNLSAHYMLVNDIDASSTKNWNSGSGFEPLGSFSSHVPDSFTGSLDGGDHKILNLNIFPPGRRQYVGLFGCIGSTGVIRNLVLENINVSGWGWIGGLAGYNIGIISNCILSGQIAGTEMVIGGIVGENNGRIVDCQTSMEVQGNWIVGGFVGHNKCNITTSSSNIVIDSSSSNYGGFVGSNEGIIKESFSQGDVRGFGFFGGGFVGSNLGSTEDCYSICDVVGEDEGYIGGFCGSNTGNISMCYSTGSVEGNYYVGGLVGENNGMIKDCYSSGNVTGFEYYFGGLVGDMSDGEVINSHYNVDSVLINGEKILSIGGVFNKQYIDWIVNDKTLRISDYSDTIEQEGDYYCIDNVEGFYDVLGFCNLEEFKFCLSSDIDFEDHHNFFIPFFSAKEFNGNNFTISNLRIHLPSSSFGFIGINNGGTLKNIILTDCNITGYGPRSRQIGGIVGKNIDGYITDSVFSGKIKGIENIGGIIGKNSQGLISRCSFNGNITGDSNVGGIAGYNEGEVVYCSTSGMVNGSWAFIGGIIGSNWKGEISNCNSQARIIGRGSAGGIAGENGEGNLSNCLNSGKVTGWHSVGGLVGSNRLGSILESFSKGEVLGTDMNIGGLVGQFQGGFISASFSTGKVKGGPRTGGLIGSNLYNHLEDEAATVSECYSTGDVEGVSTVGGFMGYNEGKMTHCYSRGDVTGDSYIGGFIGFNGGVLGEYIGTIDSCSASGDVIGKGSNVGGFSGTDFLGTISDCYSIGSVQGMDENIGGFVGKLHGGILSNCYSLGYVSVSERYYGGFVGNNGSGEVEKCYWDVESSNVDFSYGGIGKTTEEMKKKSTYNGWDLENTWNIVEDVTCPFFSWQFPPPTLPDHIDNPIEDEGYSHQLYQNNNLLPGTSYDLKYDFTTDCEWLKINEYGLIYGFPKNDDVGDGWLQINVSDNIGYFFSRNYSFSIINSNDPPVILDYAIPEINANQNFFIELRAIDIDPTMDNLYWSLKTDASFLSIDPSTGNLSGIPTNDDVGLWWVNLTVSDGNGEEDWTNFTLAVVNVNDRPQLNLTELMLTFKEDSLGMEYDLNDLFFDVDGDDLDFEITGSINLTISIIDGIMNITPEANWFGTEIIEITASDGDLSNFINVTINVTSVNDAPYDVNIFAESSYIEGEDQVVNSAALDVDIPYGDELTFSWQSNISGEIGEGQSINLSLPAGNHLITLTVTDFEGLSSQATMEIEILPKAVPGDDDTDDTTDDDTDGPEEKGMKTSTILIIVGAIVLILAVILVIVFFLLRKKPDEENYEQTEKGSAEFPDETEEQIPVDIIQPLNDGTERYLNEPSYPELGGSEPPLENELDIPVDETPIQDEVLPTEGDTPPEALLQQEILPVEGESEPVQMNSNLE